MQKLSMITGDSFCKGMKITLDEASALANFPLSWLLNCGVSLTIC